jgi:hypothetical protein
MNKRNILLTIPLAVGILATGLVFADRDEHEREDEYEEHEHERGFLGKWFEREPMAMNAEENALYVEECGGCHFPFQPGFLPAASWSNIMQGLEDHFGEYAELSPESHQQISNYLIDNAADNRGRGISKKVVWSMRYTPETDRITESAFFRHEHRETPQVPAESRGESILLQLR